MKMNKNDDSLFPWALAGMVLGILAFSFFICLVAMDSKRCREEYLRRTYAAWVKVDDRPISYEDWVTLYEARLLNNRTK